MRLLGTLGIGLALLNALFDGGASGEVTVTVNRSEDRASGGMALTEPDSDGSGGKAVTPSYDDTPGDIAVGTPEGDIAGEVSVGQTEGDIAADVSATVSDHGDTSQDISASQSERDASEQDSDGLSEEGYASGGVQVDQSESDDSETITVGQPERDASGHGSASLPREGDVSGDSMVILPEYGDASGETMVRQPEGDALRESRVRRQGEDDPEEVSVSPSDIGESVQEDTRACTVHDLLPLPCESKSLEWSSENDAEAGYDCTCAAMKGRYFCPSQGRAGVAYPKWEPRAVSQGECRSKTRADMAGAPLPPNAKLLFYGNSHLRQVVEGIMCMFQAELASKRVTIGVTYRSPGEGVEATVFGDMQCRECSAGDNLEWITPVAQELLDHQCIAEAGSCRCDDNQGEYTFENGAVVQFQFSHDQKTKGLTDARNNHGMVQLSSYDAVFVNPGNHPSIDSQSAVEMGLEVQAAGTQFFWLSAYGGNGRISEWSTDQMARFFLSGAKYVDVQCMALGMEAWTKGGVEGGVEDEHFCMPGPPNEIGLLVLKLIWAMFEDESK